MIQPFAHGEEDDWCLNIPSQPDACKEKVCHCVMEGYCLFLRQFPKIRVIVISDIKQVVRCRGHDCTLDLL